MSDNGERVRRVDRYKAVQARDDTAKQEASVAMDDPAPTDVSTINPERISQVVIVSGHSKTKATSAIGRGAVGAALLGPVGLLAAASAKKKDIVTLLIHYANGRTETVKTKVGSSEFKKLAPHIKG